MIDPRASATHGRALRLGAVATAALLLGALTSFAQTVLPPSLAPLANSASGWTIVTIALVASVRPGPVLGALAGTASFVALVLGYTVASELRGFAYDPSFWLVVSVVAGPVVGAAAAAIGAPRPATRLAGAAVLGGLLVADALRGLTVLADTTAPASWVGVLLLGLGLAPGVAVLGRRRPARPRGPAG